MDAIEEFFQQADEREPELRDIDALIRQAAPELKRFKMGKMLGYGPYHYKYASGREGDTAAVALANQKNYISLYVLAVKEDGTYLAEAYSPRLGKVSTGKSCIRFKQAADLQFNPAKKMLRQAVEWYMAQPDEARK